MKAKRNRYHMREFFPGQWYVLDRENFDLPIYDEKGYKPLVFDEDRAWHVLELLNTTGKQTKG